MSKIFSKWYLYIILALVSSVSFCILLNVRVSPKADQRITFFIGAVDSDVSKLNNKCKEFVDDNVMAINYRYHNIHASNFTFIYSSFREDSDFFILPIDYVNKNLGRTASLSANLNEEYINSKLNYQFDYLEVEGNKKAIKVYDSLTEEGILKDYVTYIDEEIKCDYYLFFEFDSVNIGEIHSRTKTDNAFKVISELMKL